MRYTTVEQDQTAIDRMEAWRTEEKVSRDIALFSPRMQQIIKDYEAKQEADRLARETDLEYLCRTRPDMTEGERVNHMFWNAIAGKSIRERMRVKE